MKDDSMVVKEEKTHNQFWDLTELTKQQLEHLG